MKRAYVAVIGLAAIGAAMGLWLHLNPQDRVPVHGMPATVLEPPRPLPEFALIDQDTRPFNRARLRGRWSLLFFGFTSCADICPGTLALLAAASRSWHELPLAVRPQIVFVSVDGQRDTPPVLKTYLQNFDPTFIAVTGAQDQLDRLTRALRVRTGVVRQDRDDYRVNHPGTLLLVNPHGELQASYGPPRSVQSLSADYRRLVSGGTGQ